MSDNIIDLTISPISDFDPDRLYIKGDLVMYNGKLHIVVKPFPSSTTYPADLREIVRKKPEYLDEPTYLAKLANG